MACQLWSRPNIPAQSWGPCREPRAPRPSILASSVFKTGHKLEGPSWLSFRACMCRATGRLKLHLVHPASRWTPSASAFFFTQMKIMKIPTGMPRSPGCDCAQIQSRQRINTLGHLLCGKFPRSFLFPHWVFFFQRQWDITLTCLLKQHLIINQSSKEF